MDTRWMLKVDQMQVVDDKGKYLGEIPDFASYVTFLLDVNDQLNGEEVYYGQVVCMNDADDIRKKKDDKEDNLVIWVVEHQIAEFVGDDCLH